MFQRYVIFDPTVINSEIAARYSYVITNIGQEHQTGSTCRGVGWSGQTGTTVRARQYGSQL